MSHQYQRAPIWHHLQKATTFHSFETLSKFFLPNRVGVLRIHCPFWREWKGGRCSCFCMRISLNRAVALPYLGAPKGRGCCLLNTPVQEACFKMPLVGRCEVVPVALSTGFFFLREDDSVRMFIFSLPLIFRCPLSFIYLWR